MENELRKFECRTCFVRYSLSEVSDSEDMEPVYCPFCGDYQSDEDDDVGPVEVKDEV